MGFTQPDHALQLTSRGGDPAVVAPRVGSGIPHLDVGLHERIRRFGSEDGLNVVASPGDVGSKVLDFLQTDAMVSWRSASISSRIGAHHDIGTGSLRLVLEVQADQVLREHAVALIVDLVEDEVQQVETRDQGRRQVDVARDGPLEVVLGPDGVGCREDRSTGVQGGDDTGLRD